MVRLSDLTERIVSASATLIAIVAMATAVYQAKLSREQARASVWPYLIQGNSGNNGYSRIIQNVGMGPAIIKAFELRVDGNPVQSWKEAADSLKIQLTGKGMKTTTFRAGIVLPTGILTELLEAPDSADIRALRANMSRIDSWVCYCSLYGDCWEELATKLEPERVSKCIDDPKRRFLQ